MSNDSPNWMPTNDAQRAELDEKLIGRFMEEDDKRKVKCRASLAAACPLCGAKPGEPCGYIALESHFGENLPDEWTHSDRRSAHERGEREALEKML